MKRWMACLVALLLGLSSLAAAEELSYVGEDIALQRMNYETLGLSIRLPIGGYGDGNNELPPAQYATHMGFLPDLYYAWIDLEYSMSIHVVGWKTDMPSEDALEDIRLTTTMNPVFGDWTVRNGMRALPFVDAENDGIGMYLVTDEVVIALLGGPRDVERVGEVMERIVDSVLFLDGTKPSERAPKMAVAEETVEDVGLVRTAYEALGISVMMPLGSYVALPGSGAIDQMREKNPQGPDLYVYWQDAARNTMVNLLAWDTKDREIDIASIRLHDWFARPNLREPKQGEAFLTIPLDDNEEKKQWCYTGTYLVGDSVLVAVWGGRYNESEGLYPALQEAIVESVQLLDTGGAK